MALSEDGSHDGIMSERTLNIAGKIYAELQTMIRVHGDEVSSMKQNSLMKQNSSLFAMKIKIYHILSCQFASKK